MHSYYWSNTYMKQKIRNTIMFEYKKWKKKSIERAADTNKKETYDTHFMITTDATVFRKNNNEQEKKTSENHKKNCKNTKEKNEKCTINK